MSRHLSKIIISLISLVFVSAVPASSIAYLTEDGTSIPNEVKIGSEITASMIDIEYAGETKKATSCAIYTPSGALVHSNKIVFSEAGKYKFDFSAVFGEQIITKTVETISVRTPSSMFIGSNVSISEGSFAYNDKLDSSVGLTDYKGIRVNSHDGGTVTFNKILDFSNASKNDPFIDFIVEPSTLGAYDTGEIVITLTDADDPNNKVDIRYVDGLAGSGGAMRLTYASARASGQYYAGYENWNGLWHINNDQTGTPTFLSLRGLDDQIITEFGTGYLNSQVFFEYSSKSIFVKSEYSVIGSTVLINDLDSSEIYPTNPWSGFKNNRAILSITTNDVSGSGAKYVIKSIFGYDFFSELLRDSEAPKLSIDYNQNDKYNLPLAKKDGTYPIFKCDVFDNYDDDLIFKKSVQFFDGGEGTYIDIDNDGNRFSTNYCGKYKVTYYCSDRSGNVSSDSYIVHCSNAAKDIEIILPDDSNIYHAFETVTLPSLDDIEIKNAQGKVDVHRYLTTPDGNLIALSKDYFTPDKIGLYKVTYVVDDIYESPVTSVVEYDIQNIAHPVIVEKINLPDVVVSWLYTAG